MSNAETHDELEGIAVVGMSGRFPGADDLEEFWQNLKSGTESVTFFTDEELLAAGVAPEALRQPNYVKARGILKEIERFDASFFGFTPREAEVTDPQHRLFLECAWQAMESAGYDSDSYEGAVGIFAGCSMSNYLNNNLLKNRALLTTVDSLRVLLGNDKDYLPTWASYKLNLKGPSVDVQTTCSTSLVAVHLACQSLLNYQCDMALAGGVSLDVPQRAGYLFRQGGINPSDGHCRAFDARSQGSVNGSGAGVVVLKRLEDALAEGANVLAVIRGTALNNDGAAKVSYTAPSVEGQAEVIALAQAVSGVHPETITYVEAHGSGTPLGDPIEVAALTQAFRAATAKKGFCAIGSVKTNIGHVGAAAGAAGLIKTVLALQHRLLPPSLNYEEPNAQIGFEETPFYVNARASEWKTDGGPRRAGVSSFGVGGTNAHVIVEEAPPRADSDPAKPWQLLLLSARTEAALEAATDNLAAHLRRHPGQRLADIAYTLKLGRRAFGRRRALVCRDGEDAAAALEARSPRRLLNGSFEGRSRSVAFMFPGLGDHYVNLAAGLYETQPKFREQVDLCCELFGPHLGVDLRDVLYPGRGAGAEASARQPAAAPAEDAPRRDIDLRRMLLSQRGAPDEATRKLNQTRLAQPAVFVVEYALARLWMSWGVKPEALIGYSVGEYVAACLAGVFSLEDAVRLVAQRARMIQELPGGSMLAVPLPEAEVRPLLRDGLRIAGINGPSLCVVSGESGPVASLERELKERGVTCQQLQTTHAFHSKMMEPIAASFTALVETVKRHPPRIPFISNVTGTWITEAEAASPAYWSRHLCEAVRFADGLQELWKEPGRLLLEVGPGQMLSSLALQQAPLKEQEWVALPSVRSYYDRQDDLSFLLGAAAQLWLAGVKLDWSKFYEGERRQRLPLPTYPFERQRYWVEPDSQPAGEAEAAAQAPAGRAPDVADWFYLPTWRRSMPPRPGPTEDGRAHVWLLLADECGLGARLARRLEGEGQRVVTVSAGERFERVGERAFTLNPQRFEEYAQLVEGLDAAGLVPARVLHMWGVTAPYGRPGIELFTAAQDRGFNSFLYLMQALGEKHPEEAVHVGVVTNQIHDVAGETELCPEKTTVLVPLKMIPQVYPRITCRSIDVVVPEPGGRREERLLGLLEAELNERSSGEVVAYRGEYRWTLDYQPARVERVEGTPPRLRRRGVYLIAGGLSGVGPSLAEYLARAAQARLVLLEEVGFPPRGEWDARLDAHGAESRVGARIAEVRRLEGLGAEVEVLGADLAGEAETRAAVEHALRRFGELHGVFHTADTPAAETHATVEGDGGTHYQVKVYGAYNLARALAGRELDFCLLVSSLGSITGGAGRMPQAAANVFLNAFAHARAADAANWASVNWDEETDAEEAGEVWQHLFSAPPVPQLVVSGEDLAARLRESRAPRPGASGEEAVRVGAAALHPRPNIGVPYVPPAGPSELLIADIWKNLLGIEQVGVHDSFFQLGGNSLMGIQLISQVREAFQLDVPMSAVFEASTLGELAALVEELLLAEVEGMDERDAAQHAGD